MSEIKSKVITEQIELAGKTYVIETGKLAGQADGAVTLRCEETVVLVTAVASDVPREGVDFLPLTVDVEERMYAAGKIPGGYIKREGRPSEDAILTARLVDRPLRPSFPEGFYHDAQIIITTLSVDQINPQDILAINGASAALSISRIPFNGPIGAVRIGKVGDRWIVNPTYQELEHSLLDMVIAGNRDSILMVEAGANEVSEEVIVEAFDIAHGAIRRLIDLQEVLVSRINPTKWEMSPPASSSELEKAVKETVGPDLKAALNIVSKEERNQALKTLTEKVIERLSGTFPEQEEQIKKIIEKEERNEMRRMIIEDDRRVDGRRSDEVRPISCEVNILDRTHGSGLFTRGETQVLSVLTLGSVGEEQLLDGLGIEESKRFLHHYSFPPFSTGEVSPLRGPRRRDIGHGALAERALSPIIPDEIDFPYTIRIVSEVLSSNGSTSMGSVCASSLALMDAGVPVEGGSHVSGVAMGLVLENNRYKILTDILGIEDALGDMDFKVAGTAKGITALQMDIKLKKGISSEILTEALNRAREGRLLILEKMNEAIASPRQSLSEYAPRMITLKIPQDKIREVIGSGGKVIRGIIDETGTKIDIEDDGTIYIASKDEEGGEKARQMIEQIVKEIQVGEKYLGTVTKTTTFGAFVELIPGKEGLVHISKLAPYRVRSVEDVVNVGDKIMVEVIEIDRQNRVNLAVVQSETETPGL